MITSGNENRPTQTMEMVLVTPEMAQGFLDEQNNFRKLRSTRITHFIEVIKSGGWVADGNPLRFNQDGQMVDGQHRCEAIVKAGVSVWCWLCKGVQNPSTIDTGRSRSLAEYLEANGVTRATLTAASLNVLWMYRNNKPLFQVGSWPQIQEAMELMQQNPGLHDSICRIRQAGRVWGNGSHLAVLHYEASLTLKREADMFMDKLAIGDGLNRGDPILLLRSRADGLRDKKLKLSTHTKWALLIKAWNHWITGQELYVLKIRLTGPNAEPTPRIITALAHEDVA